MRISAIAIVEVTAYSEENDAAFVIPHAKDGISSGSLLIVDVVESQFVFDAAGTPTLIRLRALGLRADQHGSELKAVGRTDWTNLSIATIPEKLQPLHRQMTAEAVEKWKAAREAK